MSDENASDENTGGENAGGENVGDENQRLRDLILLATLPHVVFEGWTAAAMRAGIKDLVERPELGPKAGERVFPGGMIELAGHFSNWADRAMAEEMTRLDLAAMKVRQRIAAGVRLRLVALAPHREAVRRLPAFLTVSGHAAMALKCTYDTASEIWRAAGDESAGFNFYSKRAMLAPVLTSTFLYWLADEADEDGDYPETWAFLDRRIANVLKIPSLKAALGGLAPHLPTPFGVCRRFAAAVRARRPAAAAS